jgi:ferredoxin-NADP reductase
MNVAFDHKTPETDNIISFFFKPQQPFHYNAGQFIELTLPHDDQDDRGVRRWFTLASSPQDEFLQITTRITAEGSTFKKTLNALEPGTEVYMSEAMGDFVLPKQQQTPLVFVAGGIGVTPFHSMLSWLVQTGEQRPIKLLIGVRTEDDIIFQELYEKAGIHATFLVSNPSDSWGGERGQLSAEKILGLGNPGEDALIYISGPEPMVESLDADLKTAGVDPKQIVTDSFPGYAHI